MQPLCVTPIAYVALAGFRDDLIAAQLLKAITRY